MYQKGLFKGVSKEEIRSAMEQDGLRPLVIFDEPHHVYEPHQHDTSNHLVCLEGAMQLTVGKEPVNFQPGDKLIIPKNTIHFGKVGDKGCSYFYAEK
jgi:quercetin dioxygenase-like cupin family protein